MASAFAAGVRQGEKSQLRANRGGQRRKKRQFTKAYLRPKREKSRVRSRLRRIQVVRGK